MWCIRSGEGELATAANIHESGVWTRDGRQNITDDPVHSDHYPMSLVVIADE